MVDVTKLYRFIQTTNNYNQPYYCKEGSLSSIFKTWAYSQECGINSEIEDYFKTIETILDKQGCYIEIVDESCYGLGWMTKIKEIHS